MIKAYLAKNMSEAELVRRAYFDYTGKSREIVLERRPTGKPYIVGGPCHSYSDSCGYSLVVMSAWEVGGDIELRRDASRYMGVARRFFAPDEAAVASEENFFELYTAKEAYVKLTEMGIFSGMEKFSALSGRVGSVNIIHFSDGNCICAAASEHESEVELKWIY